MLIFNKNNNNNQYDYVNKSQFIVYAPCVAEAVDPRHTTPGIVYIYKSFKLTHD